MQTTTDMQDHTPALDVEDLRRTLADILDVSVTEVTDTADFVEDLDVDSLMALEILVSLERKYLVKMEQENLQQVRSLRHVHDLLVEKLQAS
ncbi:acyl carrier protein [Streptomyces sp. NBC_01275]|uniref:acyl carrier protein n=1 Tax=Streptomyces sp. NBC_01275 TaxID=2903807 RepID=UPI00225AEC60|nr:acyl carrier protein [Streptomyces sp. NBC_01275]MCX4763938.1 acyl carrier protein [Streptomyces sp. NBC_01275]